MTRARLLVLIGLFIAGGLGYAVIAPVVTPMRPDATACLMADTTAEGPSGRTLTLCNVVMEPQPSGDLWAVIRVVDPDLPQGVADHTDHDWICTHWGEGFRTMAQPPARIIVQIMAAPFPRGEPAPGISQSIEAYSLANGACQWEFL